MLADTRSSTSRQLADHVALGRPRLGALVFIRRSPVGEVHDTLGLIAGAIGEDDDHDLSCDRYLH